MYNRAYREPPHVEHSVMNDLLKDEDATLDLNKLVDQLNGEGKIISVDDILSRQKYVESAFSLNTNSSSPRHSSMFTVPKDAIPVVVTDIKCEDNDNNLRFEGELLGDLTREMKSQDLSESSVVIMHRDVLDGELKTAEDEDKALREEILKQRAVVLPVEGVRVEGATSSPPPRLSLSHSPSPVLRPSHLSSQALAPSPVQLAQSSTQLSQSSTQLSQSSTQLSQSSTQVAQPPSQRERKNSKSKGKRRQPKRSAKENIVAVDEVIRQPSTTM